jgi:acyl-CoA synthetase (AMP-forming)/AMP-acid ligase II
LPTGLDWAGARAALQAVVSSGGPLSGDAAEATHALLGQSPIEVYGSTETGGIAWRQRRRDGEVWSPLPGVAWRVEDGQLAVRSPHLPGDEWFVTADRAAPAGDGFVLQGRADRIVKIEEKRISLAAVELALRASAEVADVRVLPVDTDAGRVRLGAVATLTAAGAALLAQAGKRALVERLSTALLAHVERVALPRRWRFVPRLPADTQGKSTEALLRALFRPDRPPAHWLEGDETSATVELDIAPTLRVFDGHFDAAPLVPGVAQLDWAIGYAQQRFAVPPRCARIDALKFHRPLTPNTTVRLTMRWQAARGELSFQYASASGPHASGRVLFEA